MESCNTKNEILEKRREKLRSEIHENLTELDKLFKHVVSVLKDEEKII